MSGDNVTEAARDELLALQGRDGGWAYRIGSAPSTEPTALAGLALLALRPDGGPEAAAARSAADWLATVQRRDGSVGVSASVPEPGWATPYALLLWTATESHEARRRDAARWLLACKGRTLSREDDPNRVAGHDTTIVGWPWVADTHSWLEPTATAVLALGRSGFAGHSRVQEGLRLVRDREVDSGGWNYGNKAVFGRGLRAQPGPTGLALLALAGTGPRTDAVDRAVRYLRSVLPDTRASASLGWGLLGLRAWGETPEGSRDWVAEALMAASGRPDAAVKLTHLLLCGAPGALDLFGRGGGTRTVDSGRGDSR